MSPPQVTMAEAMSTTRAPQAMVTGVAMTVAARDMAPDPLRA